MFKWLLSCISPRGGCRLMGFVSCWCASSYLAYFLWQKPARFGSSKPSVYVCLCANASPRLCSPTVSPSIRSGSARHLRCLNNDGGLFLSFFLAHTQQGKNEIMSLDSICPCSLWIHTNSPAELERGGNLHLSKRSLLFPLELLWDGLMTKRTGQERQNRSKRCREAS